MNYVESIAYLHGTNRAFCKPGTERVQALCNGVGNPEKALPVIHVTGTNGKGSFCVILASLLKGAGYKVGRFSSPALQKINECITVNGEDISDGDFARLATELRPFADGAEDRPTEFELLTVLAFRYFEEQACDYVILECGMGGLTDATNVIDTPLLSVITGVSVDHASFLGDTVEKIALQKGGIVKKNCPVLWCGSDPTAEGILRKTAARLNAPFHRVPRDTLKIRSADLSGTVFDFDGKEGLPLSMLGLYQADNAANALTALRLLKVFPHKEQITHGLWAARWPGRFELLSADPLLIADGGHNPEGIDRALESVRAYFPEEKVVFVTGIMADKDYRSVARAMSTVAREVFTVTPPNPRALPAEEYACLFRDLGIPAQGCTTVAEGIAKALATKSPVICLGSLYMYGEVSAALRSLPHT